MSIGLTETQDIDVSGVDGGCASVHFVLGCLGFPFYRGFPPEHIISSKPLFYLVIYNFYSGYAICKCTGIG